MFSYGIALYCQMKNLAKTQIRIYRMSLKFLGDIFVYMAAPKGQGGELVFTMQLDFWRA